MYLSLSPIGNSLFRKLSSLFFLYMISLGVFAQLTSTTTQTISTTQTYTGASNIGTGTVTILAGKTVTFTGSLTIGTGGSLIIQNGAKVIVNGVVTIGTSQTGNLIVNNGGLLTVNPGASGGTAAIAINSTSAIGLDIQTGGTVIVKAPTTSLLGVYETAASNINVAGALQIRGGGFKMDNTAKLTYSGIGNDTIIGPSNAGAYFSNSTKLTVGSGVNLYISGDVKNDSNAEFAINGNVSIIGNYQSGNTTANVTGTGTLITTGSLDADSYQGTVFGEHYSCATGPCGGNSVISSTNTNTCNGGVVNIKGVAMAGATYQWLVSTTSATSGFSNASGASTAQNYSTTGSATSYYTYYKRTYTISGKTYNSNTLTITSSTWVNAASVPAIGGATSVCTGATTTLTNSLSGGVWSSDNTSIATISSSGVVTGVSAGTAIISYTVNGSSCASSKTITMNVGGSTTITAQPSPSTICAGASTSFSVTTSGIGLTYVWKENGGNISNGGIYSGASTSTLTLAGANSTQNNKTYSVYVQGACGGGILSNSALLTVDSPPSITAKTTSTCSGTAFSVIPTGVPTGTTYTWTAPTGSFITGGSAQLTGQSSIGQTLSNTSASPATAVYTVTPRSSCGAGTAFTVTVTVNPSTVIGTQPVTKSVCAGVTTTFTVAATGSGLSYIWKENGGNLTDGGIYSGTTTSTLTLSGVNSAQNNKSYSVFVQGTCGSVLSSNAVLTVSPIPTATAGGSQSICSNGTAKVAGATSDNGTIAWTENGAGSLTGATTLTPTYTAAVGDAGNAVTLTMTVSNSPCAAATATYTVNVKGIPTATAGGSQSICSNGTAKVAGATSNNGTIAWTDNGAGSITAGATTLTPTYTAAVGDAGNAVTLTMTVSNSSCTSATATYTVNVNGIPTAVAGSGVLTCSNASPINITAGSSATNNSGVTWTSSGTGIFTNGTSLTDATYAPSNADITSGTVTLTLTAIANTGCVNATSTKLLKINGAPSVTLGAYPSICAGITSTNVTYSAPVNSPNQYSINWSNAANSAGISDVSFTSLSGGIIPLTGLTSTAGIYAAVITVKNTTTACSSILSNTDFTVTIKAVPTVSSSTPASRCGTGSVTLKATASAGTIVWYNASSGGTNLSTGASFITPSISINTTYYAEAVNVSCSSASRTAVIATINPIPTIATTTAGNRCGTGTVTLEATASAGAVSWYTTSTGGSAITTGTTYTTPSISSTTTYYVDATTNSCTTGARTEVVATVDNFCLFAWTGTTSTAWNLGSNWSTGNIPTSTNDVTIPATVASGNMPTISTSANAKSVSNAGVITMTSVGTLNTYGNITNTNIFTTDSGSTVAFKGATAQTMTGVTCLHNVVINNAAGVSIGSATTVKGRLSLTKGVLTTNSNLTINFDTGGNVGYSPSDAGSISGIVTGRRDVNYKTHYVCSPFNGVTSAQVAATTPLWISPYWKMYARDFNTQNYTAVTNLTTPMSIGQGFTLSFVSAAPFILSGTYDHTLSLTTPSYSNAVIDKYIMFGNPYPATIDWESSGISKNNIQGAIYYWDGINNRSGSYVSGLGTNGGTQYIPAMQAVLVATKGTGGFSSVGINNQARISSVNPRYLRVASEDIIRIKLESSDPSQNDETVIRFNDMATTDFDEDLDANKIMNTGTIPNVYTMSGLNKYSINSYPTPDSVKVIPVFTKLPSDGSYTLKITNSNPIIQYVLVDKLLGIQQSITEAYSYSGLKSDNVGRFELQLREAITTGVQISSNTSAVNILSSPNGFLVKSNVTGTGTIDILDVTGNLVKTISNVSLSTGNNFFSPEIADGLYLIRVNIDNATYVGQVSLIK